MSYFSVFFILSSSFYFISPSLYLSSSKYSIFCFKYWTFEGVYESYNTVLQNKVSLWNSRNTSAQSCMSKTEHIPSWDHPPLPIAFGFSFMISVSGLLPIQQSKVENWDSSFFLSLKLQSVFLKICWCSFLINPCRSLSFAVLLICTLGQAFTMPCLEYLNQKWTEYISSRRFILVPDAENTQDAKNEYISIYNRPVVFFIPLTDAFACLLWIDMVLSNGDSTVTKRQFLVLRELKSYLRETHERQIKWLHIVIRAH